MPANLLPASLAILAVCAVGAALYYWRRSASLYALLVEGANRFEELRQRNGQLEQVMVKAEERLKTQREAALRQEKAVDEAREQAALLVQKLEAKEHELRARTEKLELQKGHLEKQLAKNEDRFAKLSEAAEAQRADLEARLQRATEEARLAALAQRQDAELREKELTLKLRDVEKEAAAAQRKVKEADPVELKKLKRRVAQYDRLYNSMKGLREMTDERNRNYEVALQKLAAWVVAATGRGPAPEGLGPLVGTALAAIGAQLIDESEAAPAAGRVHTIPDRGGARATSMDDGGASSMDAEIAALEGELLAEEAADAARSGAAAAPSETQSR